MNKQLIIGLILTFLPIGELRLGLPIIIEYTTRNDLFFLPYFLLVLLINISSIFFVFFFLDFFHAGLMRISFYSSTIGRLIERTAGRTKKLSERIKNFGYIALMIFVAIPLPGSGAWTGATAAWLLKLDRAKSFAAISLGVVIAGIIILLASLGFFSLIY